ncbi:MAG TPA: SPOR domain-containing protein [Steroidobacteraceae bacterium]|nr:SPOR domain-containing protein [Steroidobacteraceae bacterium]
MDRHLKERLVGAAVLLAAANILIPEMLSFPSDSAVTPASSSGALPAGADGGALKTYTIDLGKANSGGDSRSVEVTLAPPPELPVVQPPAEEPAATSQGDAQHPAQTTPAAQDQREQKAPEAKAPGPSAEKPPAPAAMKEPTREPTIVAPRATQTPENVEVLTVPSPGKAGAHWAVQVASLDTRDKSQKIVDEMKAKGLPAFVASSQVNGKTVFRARVGPVDDRAEAEALLRKVKSLHPKATIMPHP